MKCLRSASEQAMKSIAAVALADKLNKVFCPKNQELAQLLLDRKLAPSVGAIPWLATALKRDLC